MNHLRSYVVFIVSARNLKIIRGDFLFTGVKRKHKTSIVSQETSNCAVYFKFILFQISAETLVYD